MTDHVPQHELYHDLAPWWPLISPPEEYTEEAAFVSGLLRTASVPVREVLELGCGGGHMAVHLKASFNLTLMDISEDMLAMSRRLNPQCTHLTGDMRSVRLDRTFDAVFVHDAIDYMTTVEDLRRAVETAHGHCRPGGIAVFVPDYVRESFQPGTEHGGSDAADGRGARYLEWTWDPDPTDTWVQSRYAFLLKEADGTVRTVADTHRIGVYSRQTWVDTLASVGFAPTVVTEQTSEERQGRIVFVGHRPPGQDTPGPERPGGHLRE